ncbi:uncharacterized protein EHS24_002185 [Apiotrichum porosum]|uniref:Transcription initiation factor TFIID subunit 8 n=1 Tax=Apiotrichum porosum TaxID=105984 RepID=A0A427XHV0_9TREE|nr:uncharacterized protein EHS24_002185 [Apiotrichum porosum]RSH78460.1 hypothetical protein EHS24_002185 [Apiotrichum porosum]
MAHSRNTPHTHLQSGTAAAYMNRVIGQTLVRRGFDGAEAGALTEMERLLEHHIQRLFENAHDYARLSGRSLPHAVDLFAAHEDSGWDVRSLRREAKRKRAGVTLPTSEEPPEPAAPINIASIPEGDGDVKPKLAKAPEYAWDGAPALPDPWTYKPDLVPPPPPPSSKVTAGVLEFMKLTASERGDIPAELGLVDYRRADTREGRKKWGVKGIGAA